MNVSLLAPLGLAALFALALPLLIHLVRRIELRTTEFAALRWISERIRPRSRLRLERPWLLLLRLALVALIALLLARPILNEPMVSKPAWVLVAPGADLGAARTAVSIDDADWHWLAPGFPPIESSIPATPVPVASLLREIDADLPPQAKLAVVVPEQVSGLDGERPQLAHAVDWHVASGGAPAASAAAPQDVRALSVRYAPSSESALRYLRAAMTALNAETPGRYVLDEAPQSVAPADAARFLVWLGSTLPPAVTAWIEAGGTAIVDDQARATGAPIWRNANSDVL
ncbi:MAG TPA: BatA domain-containing protein, partial [Rhodanobacteraceae bacterium]